MSHVTCRHAVVATRHSRLPVMQPIPAERSRGEPGTADGGRREPIAAEGVLITSHHQRMGAQGHSPNCSRCWWFCRIVRR